jgi:transglutaminase-like putative cysteine protease
MRYLFPFLLFVCVQPAVAVDEPVRRFEFSYRILAAEFPNHDAVDIFIPLPVENADQRIVSTEFRSSIPGEQGVERTYGNRYYHIRRPANINGPIDAEFTWVVERQVATAGQEELTEEDRQRYLAPNNLVPVGHEILAPIRAEIHALRSDDSPEATAREIYDWVVDNVEYKKVGTGWGNGDTFWACSERYGNCTDFHALFVSLARSEGIPARFEIGFPVPLDRTGGEVTGYHCWVQLYLPSKGWVPIDASEAAKHPEMKELYYGTHPADRIHLTTGRDLVLSPAGKNQPLNYFVYPYVEVGGVPWKVNLQTEFSYRELDQG